MRKYTTFVLLFIMIFNTLSFATTADKNKVDSQIKTTQGKLNEAKSEKNTIIKQLVDIEEQLEKVDNTISKLNLQIEEFNTKIIQTEKDLENLEASRLEHYEALKLRMRSMYENSTTSYLDLFLKSSSFVDMLDRYYNMKLIMQKDNDLLDEIAKLEQELIDKKVELEEQKKAIVEIKAKSEKEKKDMENVKNQKDSLKSRLTAEENQYYQELTYLEKESARIESLIKNGTANSKEVYSGGKFTWPVPGYTRISSEYGNRAGFRLQDGSWSPAQFHTGIDIPAPTGTKVVAAEAGKIITAGYVSGYGYTIIIDHGSGVTTLYGHNSALVVKVGDRVTKGQQISKCGSTGNSTGPHVHFEVRKNGSHVNPHTYLQ